MFLWLFHNIIAAVPVTFPSFNVTVFSMHIWPFLLDTQKVLFYYNPSRKILSTFFSFSYRCEQLPFAKRILNGFANVIVNGVNSNTQFSAFPIAEEKKKA